MTKISSFVLALFGSVACAFAGEPETSNAVQFVRTRSARRCSLLQTQSVSTIKSMCSEKDNASFESISELCYKECRVASQRRLFGAYPSGPYVTKQNATERITIPRPPLPADLPATNRTNCPHLSTGLKLWHNKTTWGGTIPSSGNNVSIPAGVRVLINQTIVEQLGYITIPNTSQLIIGEVAAGINISTLGITVQGALVVGSATCRIQTPVTFTLLGGRPTNPVTDRPPLEYKGISVSGGLLDLHGKRYFNTWTRLAKTINPGESVLMLQDPVNWKVGQQIVLVTSTMKDSRDFNFNEVLTISDVHTAPPSGVGAVVYLSTAVKYQHLATTNYQVEVGLLSRMIKVQGDAASEPTDPDPLNGSCKDDRYNVDWTIYYNSTRPCPNMQLTGFGGHIIVHSGGVGRVEGVQLYRMGQTNVLGRYPMHFHLLGNCSACYFRDSSVHRSFYRCISVHGTNLATVTENVGYDVTGYCYYLEDGVEQFNTITYNLAAHIHTLGSEIPWGWAQKTNIYNESTTLTLAADVTASGFYITNIRNYFIGNAASGGWAGFAFPSLPTALATFKTLKFRPSDVPGLVFDGNTAHSTAWWWSEGAGAFYIGGALYYNDAGLLEYNPGRSFNFYKHDRRPCSVNACADPYNDCSYGCPEQNWLWFRMTNTKAFLSAGIGINSWSGRIEIVGYESHDNRLAAAGLSKGFWMDNMLAVCRTGTNLGTQNNRAHLLEGTGFYWYDTGQEHIITDSTFRNCGYRSAEFAQYDNSTTRGCGDSTTVGCKSTSTVFGFLTHSDQFTPEVMQGTRNITFQSCGRRFKFTLGLQETVSGRGQNWLDVDGSVSRLGVPTLIGSGLNGSKDWWGIENDVIIDQQGPLRFIKKNNGPQRAIGHFRMAWDASIHNQVGVTVCGNGNGLPCYPLGFMRHLGPKFSPWIQGPTVSSGLPVTAQPDVVGPIGGFGWLLNLNQTAPRSLSFYDLEIDPISVLMLSIPYPIGTQFDIRSYPATGCWVQYPYTCSAASFTAALSIAEVRQSLGNKYFVDTNGVLTLRIIKIPTDFAGNPNWTLPTFNTTGRGGAGTHAIQSFSRDGVLLPGGSSDAHITIQATCPSDTASSPRDGYCLESVKRDFDPAVCDSGFVQLAYDRCCMSTNLTKCKYADGSRNF